MSRDLKKSRAYVKPEGIEPCVILKCHVRLGKVKRIAERGNPRQYDWHDHGYDTVPSNNKIVPIGKSENCVYDPGRITVIAVLQAPRTDGEWNSLVTYV